MTNNTNKYLQRLGNTPVVHLDDTESDIHFFAKMEFFNPTGSVKDRAANYIITKLLDEGRVNQDTVLIESSSGNFGVALASYAKLYGLKFYCVIDTNILPINEYIIRELSSACFKVTEPDENGGFLMNRIKKVNELCDQIPNSYWINQYANPLNAEAYYYSLGDELCTEIEQIDYLFAGVSSGGTITGLSQRIKIKNPNAKVIAVDIEGSIIFGGPPKKRYIPGIGSNMVPSILKESHIDEVVFVDELATIDHCHELLRRYSIFAGGSSGSVYAAIKKYFKEKSFPVKPKVVGLFPDRGDRYAGTIFNQQWIDKLKAACIHT